MANLKTLIVRWQRLLSDGQTCPRCGTTESEIEKALAVLKQALNPLDIEVILEKVELSVEEFQKDSLQSNSIWLNRRLLDDLIGGETGRSLCCDVCGTHECRTVGLKEVVYESIHSELIVKGGLLAAAQLLGPQAAVSEPETSPAERHCCPK